MYVIAAVDNLNRPVPTREFLLYKIMMSFHSFYMRFFFQATYESRE